MDRKLNNQPYDWIRRIAQHYEKLLKQFDKAPHVALEYCMDAIENYQKIRDDRKVKELEKRYSEFKGAVDFTSSEVVIEHNRNCEGV